MATGWDRLVTAQVHTKLRQRVGDRTVIRAQRLVAPVVRRSLTALAVVYWCDKASGHRYTPIYRRHLRHLRRRPIRLLEIGIGGYRSPTWGGASLRMWRDYFPRGEIHGVDIHEKRIDEPRIRIHRGDQSDEEFMGNLGRECGPFDVIVDDGSHKSAHIRASFAALFGRYLRPGGLYVIEDLACAYDPKYGGGPPGHASTSVELVKSLIDDVNVEPRPVAAVHVYEQIAFIEKART
jgi:demethylmacrocin O-methyltransferase